MEKLSAWVVGGETLVEIVTATDLLELFAVAEILADTVDVTGPAFAAKFAAFEPAGTFTEDGSVSNEVDDESRTAVEAVTLAERLTVQLEVPPETSALGEHAIAESTGGVDVEPPTETVVDLLTPPHAAVNVTAVRAETVPALELKLAEAAPAGITTEAGTGNTPDELTSVTVALLTAGAVSVAVHVVVPPETTDAGEHAMPESATPGEIVTDVDVPDPFAVAVTFADTADFTGPADAAKTVELQPAGTVTEAGTAKTSLDDDS